MSGVPLELYNAWGQQSLVGMVGKFIAFSNKSTQPPHIGPSMLRNQCSEKTTGINSGEAEIEREGAGHSHQNLPMIRSNCDPFGHSMEKCRFKSNEGDVPVRKASRLRLRCAIMSPNWNYYRWQTLILLERRKGISPTAYFDVSNFRGRRSKKEEEEGLFSSFLVSFSSRDAALVVPMP